MPELFISIWCLDTTYPKPSQSITCPKWCLLDLDAKLAGLETLVGLAHKEVVTLNKGAQPAFHLFTAPEFTFAAHETLNAIKSRPSSAGTSPGQKLWSIADFAYDMASMQKISGKIAELAGNPQYRNLVLAPGTVFWKLKNVDFKTRSQYIVVNGHQYEFRPGEDSLVIGGTTYYRRDIRTTLFPEEGMPVEIVSDNPESRMNLGLQKDVRKGIKDALDSTALKVRLGNVAVDDLAAIRNVALFATQSGILPYEKMYPDDSEYGEVFTVFTPGKSIFVNEFYDVKMAAEICADHANGVLQTASNQAVDVHLVMSAYVSLDEACIIAKDKGVVVLADSHHPSVFSFSKAKKAADPQTPVVEITYGGAKVQIFRVTV